MRYQIALDIRNTALQSHAQCYAAAVNMQGEGCPGYAKLNGAPCTPAGVVGVLSDRPATVTYFANCMGLEWCGGAVCH